MLACRILGHRFRFRTESETMIWECSRGCGAGGRKTYATITDAVCYARDFDQEDRDDLGRRAPPLGMLPLRLYDSMRRKKR